MVRVEGKYRAKRAIKTFFEKDDILLVKNLKERKMCTECDLHTWNGEFLCRMATNSIVAEMLELVEADEPTDDRTFYLLVDLHSRQIESGSSSKEELRQIAKVVNCTVPSMNLVIYRKEEEVG